MKSSTKGSGSLALAVRLAGSVAGIALVMPALAQQAPQTAQAQTAQSQAAAATTTTIEITGTRIRDANVTAEAPVTSVSSQELKFEGTTNVENLLNTLPSVLADQNSGVSNGASGTANIDLRGLGAIRTLVLIDGRRLGPGDPAAIGGSAADVNFIPGPLVDSIEVLTGGASTDYGSDALAGVVNFHMKRDFEGVEIDQQINFAQNNQGDKYLQGLEKSAGDPVPGDSFDGFTRQSTLIFGVNAPNGKGNVTMYLTDLRQDPVLQSARDYTACGVEDASARTWHCFGSANDRLFISPSYNYYTFNPTSTPANTGAGKPNPGWALTNASGGTLPIPRFNFAPFNYLQRDDQRYTAGSFAHYEVADWADLYGEFGVMDDHTLAQIAPSGLFIGGGNGTVTIPCSNPLLSPQEQGFLGCAGNAGSATILTPGYRFANLPGLGSLPRIDNLRHTDYRFVTGSRGEIPETGGWTYDVSIQYFTSILSENYQNDVSYRKVVNALDVVNVNGVATCESVVNGTDPNCVPLNIFANGGITKAALNYVVTPGFQSGQTGEMVAGGNVSGDFGSWGGKSPLAKDPVGAVFGYEYRTESLVFNTDTEFQTGDLLGQGASVKPVNGSFDDNDFYAEAQVPVVQDMFLAKEIKFDTGIRISDYDVNGTANTYSTTTWKLEGDWAPIEDFKLRGGYNRAARAPNTFELFQPAVIENVGLSDPCGGTTPTASLAACEASGVKASQYGHIVQCPAGQCSEQVGGNLALQPETGDTWTWGMVLTPTVIPNFTASVDYWDIGISNYIQDLGIAPSITVNQCLKGTTSACSLIHRAPGSGIIFGAEGFVVAQNTNVNNVHTSGLDFAAAYKEDLAALGAPGLGSVTLSFTGTLTTDFTTSLFKNGVSYNCAGDYGLSCGEPDPKWRHLMRATWSTPWDADISVAWRHVGGSSLDSNQQNPLLYAGIGNVDYIDGHIGAKDYFDLAGTWQINKVLQFRAGINNIFDIDPPVVAYNLTSGLVSGNNNVFTGNYDTLGRTLYMGLNAKF